MMHEEMNIHFILLYFLLGWGIWAGGINSDMERASDLIGIDGPVSKKLWQHCSQKPKDSARSTDRDIVLNKKGGQNATTKSWY